MDEVYGANCVKDCVITEKEHAKTDGVFLRHFGYGRNLPVGIDLIEGLRW